MRWKRSHRADRRAVAIADRHYSRQQPGTPQFVPPGRPVVLITPERDALWVSLAQKHVDHAWPGAWLCQAFRNESAHRSSELITEAVAATRFLWGDPPAAGFITFVDPAKVRHKRDPGRCFVRAGWRRLNERTKGRGLVVLHLEQVAFAPPLCAVRRTGVGRCRVTAPTRPVLRYHGGKWRLAPWIISFFPPHRVYVEPFGGAASVLVRKPRVYAEVYNDLDDEIVNLFRVLRDQGEALGHLIELTPYARLEFDESFSLVKDPVERARRTVVRSFMGFGGNLTRPNRDQSPQRTGFRDYSSTKRRSTPAGDWRNWPEALPALVDRLRGVIVEHRDAATVMAAHDGEDSLHYVDPPYVHSTRGFDSGSTHRGYRHEMIDDDHRALAALLRGLRGMVVVSGYPSELYDRELFADWERHERSHVADGARKRIEVVWLNAACTRTRNSNRPQLELHEVAS